MRSFVDERGEILFNIDTLPFEIKQCFTSRNNKNVLRGLHCSPYPKYITVNSGKIFDVIVKPDGTYDSYILNERDSLLIPANCAHGYFCYEESEVIYFLGGKFQQSLEKNYIWNDPYLNIKWPCNEKDIIISDKDLNNNPYTYTNVLVTGGNGFIASNFIIKMKKIYPYINFISLSRNGDTLKGDICDRGFLEKIIKEYKFDTIFHFASQINADGVNVDLLDFTHNNVYGTHCLLETVRTIKPDTQIINFSSYGVYGPSVTDTPFKEDDSILNPTNLYSASKAASEMIVNAYVKSYKLNIKTIRSCTVYGPNQNPYYIIPKFIKLLKNGEPCTINGLKTGESKRAFLHVEDVVNAVDIVWKNGKPGEVYNVTADVEITIQEIAELLVKAVTGTTDYDKWIVYVDDGRPFNDNRYYISSEKIKKLGWSQNKTKEDIYNFAHTI